MLRYAWIALLAAGCAAGGPGKDDPADPLTGEATPVELDLAASGETPARIGVASWAVEVTHARTIVRGLAQDGTPLGEVEIAREALPDRQSRITLTVRLDHEVRLVADSHGTVTENTLARDAVARAWLDEVRQLRAEGVTGKSFRDATCAKNSVIAVASCAAVIPACSPPAWTVTAGIACAASVGVCGGTGYDALDTCGLLSSSEQNQRPDAPPADQNPQQDDPNQNVANNGQDPADGVEGDGEQDPIQMASAEDGQQDPGAEAGQDDGDGYDNYDPDAQGPAEDGGDGFDNEEPGADEAGQDDGDGFDDEEPGADEAGQDDGDGYDNYDPDQGADPGDDGFDPGADDGGYDPGADDGGYDPGDDGFEPGADDGGYDDGGADDGGYDDGGYDDGGYDDGGYDDGGYDDGGYDDGGYDDGGYDDGGYDDGGYDDGSYDV